ncbi:MAG: IS1096 element passenger TnpR family protein [Nocardioidaceae bacterium]
MTSASRTARTAPPDDCGGIWGYQELLDILADPNHPEHAERVEWFDEFTSLGPAAEFDPSALDLDELDELVQDMFE